MVALALAARSARQPSDCRDVDTIAAASLYSLHYATLARTTLAMTLLYGVGGVAAARWNALVGKPIPLAYVIAFGLLALGSMLWLLIGVEGFG